MGIKRIRKYAALVLLCLGLWGMLMGVQAGSGAQISYSPDGQAFTTNSGDTSAIWYEEGTTVRIGNVSRKTPGEGEHIYYWKRTGTIPIAYWKVSHPYGKCIHQDYTSMGNFHGVSYGTKRCGGNYYSGWTGYCADCGEIAMRYLVYMSADTAAALTEIRTGMSYYYLCPWCSNLEQGREIPPHTCQEISANRYRVVYEACGGGGYMAPSSHMYNNASSYEGREVTPQTRLTLCSFRRDGYSFSGWNTRQDGTGDWYEDGAEILNLSDQEDGQITLYAQWSANQSLLRIDPAGGSYQGKKGITTVPGDYGSTYMLDSGSLTPPAGYKVSFDTCGGNRVDSIVGRQVFREWSMGIPFNGLLKNNIYSYQGDNGTEDTVKAVYLRQNVILPEAYKAGCSFGGWYYDRECTRLAGSAGSSFTPGQDITLYAGWVELQLRAEDNYSANGGRGAVDLSWGQQDNISKSYRLYQQREGQEWQQISSATDVGNGRTVSRSLEYTGRQGSYQIPYSGFYRLTLTGAQGGNYGSYKGGKGGMVQGTFYFVRGETLSYELGGQNGYHGGGFASVYGVGGGYSQLSSDRQGLLLIAGGGGGATEAQDGMPGGSAQRNVSSSNGESGKAGGGGGRLGGSGGTWVTHQHSADCRHLHTGDAVNGGGCYTVAAICESTSFRQEYKGSTFYYGNKDAYNNLRLCVRCNSYVCPGHTDKHYRNICTKCGTDYDEHKPAVCEVQMGYTLSCGRTENYICGMTQNQVLSSTPAYGGSNYICAEKCSSYTEQAGWQSGNGALQINSVALGYMESSRLDGVVAADLSSPKKIDMDTIELMAVDENLVRVSFKRPQDRGTTYYHKVESYPTGSDRMICCSNVTANTLTTQVQGYRYVVDNMAATVVKTSDRWHGDSGSSPSFTISMNDSVQYLHIAAQDKAGNLGETIHIRLSEQTVIAWPVRTEQLKLEQSSSVWPAAEEDTYYVRAGENTPFGLTFTGALCGPARKDYQITHLFFASQDMTGDGEEGRLGVITPVRDDISPGTFYYQAAQLQKVLEGQPCVGDGGYTMTKRSNRCRDLEISQKLYLPEHLDKHRIRLTPVAAAKNGRDVVVSDYSQDLQNSIWLIVDAQPPSISGMEQLEAIDFMEERETESIEVELTAQDTGSGLAEFFVEIYNTDNGSSRKITDQGTGVIRMSLSSEDALFSGEFTVTAHAVDHVGNEATAGSRLEGLTLHVTLERVLEPHNPVFKAGESGLLTIVATGYVERIEVIFPEEMTAFNPSLDHVYEYDIPDYIQTEKLTFMVPLGVPEAVMDITVRAYKRDTDIEQHPQLATMAVEGSVLDEVRTRLK